MYEGWKTLLKKTLTKTSQLKRSLKTSRMNSTESKIGLLLEDAQTALERGVKRGAVKMDIQLEIRFVSLLDLYFCRLFINIFASIMLALLMIFVLVIHV